MKEREETMPEKRKTYQIGCYADGALGSAHAREIMLDLLDDAEIAIDSELRAALEGDMSDDCWEEDEAMTLLNASPYTPEHTYWGYDDHGAGFGLWPCWNIIEEERRTGDLPDTDTIGEAYRGLHIEVSDHGNVTLWHRDDDGTDRELWSVV